jgi:hypothetical protein
MYCTRCEQYGSHRASKCPLNKRFVAYLMRFFA